MLRTRPDASDFSGLQTCRRQGLHEELAFGDAYRSLRPVRELVKLGGADIELLLIDSDLEGEVLLTRLVIPDSAFIPGALSKQILEHIALSVVGSIVPSVRAVRVADPREP